jgi:hypothetical protein
MRENLRKCDEMASNPSSRDLYFSILRVLRMDFKDADAVLFELRLLKHFPEVVRDSTLMELVDVKMCHTRCSSDGLIECELCGNIRGMPIEEKRFQELIVQHYEHWLRELLLQHLWVHQRIYAKWTIGDLNKQTIGILMGTLCLALFVIFPFATLAFLWAAVSHERFLTFGNPRFRRYGRFMFYLVGILVYLQVLAGIVAQQSRVFQQLRSYAASDLKGGFISGAMHALAKSIF